MCNERLFYNSWLKIKKKKLPEYKGWRDVWIRRCSFHPGLEALGSASEDSAVSSSRKLILALSSQVVGFAGTCIHEHLIFEPHNLLGRKLTLPLSSMWLSYPKRMVDGNHKCCGSQKPHTIVLAGAAAVGKPSFLMRLCKDDFEEIQVPPWVRLLFQWIMGRRPSLAWFYFL